MLIIQTIPYHIYTSNILRDRVFNKRMRAVSSGFFCKIMANQGPQRARRGDRPVRIGTDKYGWVRRRRAGNTTGPRRGTLTHTRVPHRVPAGCRTGRICRTCRTRLGPEKTVCKRPFAETHKRSLNGVCPQALIASGTTDLQHSQPSQTASDRVAHPGTVRYLPTIRHG